MASMRLAPLLALFVAPTLAEFSAALSASPTQQSEAQVSPLDFAERFALSDQRGELLQELIEGTDDYFYYSCLEAQAQGRFDQAQDLLKQWGSLKDKSQHYWVMANRQALFNFEFDTEGSLKYLRNALGLTFNHQRQAPGAELGLATSLDPNFLDRANLIQRAFNLHRSSLDGFRETALFGLASAELSKKRLGDLLDRLVWPTVPNLASLVVRDLDLQKQNDLGGRKIHARMTLQQLDECLRLRPSLLQGEVFVDSYLKRLVPNEDVNWRTNPRAREAYLSVLEAFTQRLSPAFNSLRAHVLHHRLQHDLELDRFDRARLIQYLRLPRRAPYVAPQLSRQARGAERVNPNQSFDTGLAPIGDDEALIRACLGHFFVGDANTAAFDGLLREEYLRSLFAETKLLAGVGDRAQWYGMLGSASQFEQLEQRVELDFAPTQQRQFGASDPVRVVLDVKNVPRLLVKVYQIDAFNYYRALEREVDASIELDGLVPNVERALDIDAPSLRRVRQSIDLPSLAKPGVYVVELVGGGVSSRAVIRKGELRFSERLTSAGHAFRVFDGDGRPLNDAKIWFGGRELSPNKSGEIYIPYSTQPGSQSFILLQGELASLGRFSHRKESYALQADVYLDREALLGGELAQVLVRPSLLINSTPAALSLLQDPVLTIRSQGQDGVASSLEVRDLELSAKGEVVTNIRVPKGLKFVSVELRGKVRSLTQAKDETLQSAPQRFQLNRINATQATDSPLLSRSDQGFALDVLGKDGEPRSGRAVNLRFELEDFTDDQTIVLQTDQKGRIQLGDLEGVRALWADGFKESIGPWLLRGDFHSYSSRVSGVTGEVLRIPYMEQGELLRRSDVALFELRSGVVVRDAFAHLALKGGFLELSGLEAGDYELELVKAQARLSVNITQGQWKNNGDRERWAIGRSRWLAEQGRKSLQITSAELQEGELQVRLENTGPSTRVHVFSSRYWPAYALKASLGGAPRTFHRPYPKRELESDYQSGRALSDEVRYVLDRRFAARFPGNMLRRPGMLLNPWTLEDTQTAIGVGGGAGGRFGGRGGGGAPSSEASRADALQQRGGNPGIYPDLDFLPEASHMLANLRPDADGLLRIPLEDLGAGQELRILALDQESRVLRTVFRPETEWKPRSHVLADALTAGTKVAERRRIEFLADGAVASFEELPGSEVELVDSLASVFQLFQALSGDSELNKFAFLLTWSDLDQAAKRALFSEFTCHELDLFLFEKDRPFFDEVVRPHLANKLDPDFMDDWLLERDLGKYTSPWAFARLNIVERVLLAQATGEASVLRNAMDLADVLPDDPAQKRRSFDALMGAGDLQAQDKGVFGRRTMREQEEAKAKAPAEQSAGASLAQAFDVEDAPARGRLAESRKRKDDGRNKEEDVMEEPMMRDALNSLGYSDADEIERQENRALYRAVDPTRRLLETYYHGRTIQEERYELIAANGFWRDFAQYTAQEQRGPFLSPHLAQAAGSTNEMLLALALLDLPFNAPEHEVTRDGNRTTLKAGGPLLVVRRELSALEPKNDAAPILVSQSYFRLDEPQRREGNRMVDAFVTEEFVAGVSYGCRVVVTNPTSSGRQLELLLQIPKGALPVQNGFVTRGVGLELSAYGTETLDYAFYFPRPGVAAHYPAQVTESERFIAEAEARSLPVVAQATKVDKSSWDYVSQNGSLEDVLSFLDSHQPQSMDLGRIAWRMGDREAFDAILQNLSDRHVYSNVLWSYGLLHGDRNSIRETLRHADHFVSLCGPVLNSELLRLDPVERRTYQRTEFEPLVLARSHEFGGLRDVQNASVLKHYSELLECMTYGGLQGPEDKLDLAYNLLLQNRIEEALGVFSAIDSNAVKARLQYDYMRCYMAFFGANPQEVRSLAEGYLDYPVEEWRLRFAEVVSQLDEAWGADPSLTNPDDRDQNQSSLAAQAASLELEVEAGRIRVKHSNLDGVELRYYPMDVELLFSSHPFGAQALEAFSFVKPTLVQTVAFNTPDEGIEDLALPEEFANSNVVVESRGGGVVRRQASFASTLSVRMMENYGQLQVRDARSGAPLSRTYVKVFARMGDGSERFHKDGYTDLRGRFDYASLSGSDLGGLQRFAILVLDDEHGAEVREAIPPQQ